MDKFYSSEKFRKTLKDYESMRDDGTPCYLEPEQFTDVAQYYYDHNEPEKALQAATYGESFFPGATAPLAFQARMALLRDQDVDKAYECLDRIVDKSDLDYIYVNAEILIAQNKADEADEYLTEQMENLSSEDIDEYALDAALMFGDYEEFTLAEKWLKQSNSVEENEYKELQAMLLMFHGNFKDGENIVNELLDADPFNTPYWNLLAQSQLQHNDIQKSIESSEYSIAINPNDPEAILNKANGLFMLGNYKDSYLYFQKYSKLCPKDELSSVEVTLGHLLLLQEDIIGAQKHFQRSITLSNGNTDILLKVAISIMENGFVHYAYKLLKTILYESKKDYHAGWGCLARCCYELDKMDEYKACLRQAVRLCPDEAETCLSDLYPGGLDVSLYPVSEPKKKEKNDNNNNKE